MSKLKSLKVNSYFVMEGRSCPFFLDEERKVTRLADGVFVTGLFESQVIVKEIEKQEAITSTTIYRKENYKC